MKYLLVLLAVLLAGSVLANAVLVRLLLAERGRWSQFESRANARRNALDIEIHLPEVKAASRPSRLLIVIARKNGRYDVSGKELSDQDLRTVIRDAVAQDPGQKVLVRSDASAEFHHVAKVLVICRELGVLEANIGVDYKPVETQPRNQGTDPDQ